MGKPELEPKYNISLNYSIIIIISLTLEISWAILISSSLYNFIFSTYVAKAISEYKALQKPPPSDTVPLHTGQVGDLHQCLQAPGFPGHRAHHMV